MGKKVVGVVCALIFTSVTMGVTFYCGPICGDVDGSCSVDIFDEIAFFPFIGHTKDTADPEQDGSCLEGLCSKDGYLDADDVTDWNGTVNMYDWMNLCSMPLYKAWLNCWFPEQQIKSSSGDTNHGNDLLISGMGTNNGYISGNEGLYVYNQQMGHVGDPFVSAAAHANGHLVCDAKGRTYQLATNVGLTRLNDGVVVVPHGVLSVAEDPRYHTGALVAIEMQHYGNEYAGRPIRDVAMDSQGYIYVAPVVVHTSSPAATYLAAAKLQLQDNTSNCYSIVRLYDDPPQVGDNQDANRNGLREVEVDADGNVFVANAFLDNASDFLWSYPASGGSPTKVALDNISGVTGGIPDPIALCASKKSHVLYLASGFGDPDATATNVYVLSTETLSVLRTVQINGMGHVTGITEDPATGDIWVVGFTMPTLPETITANMSPFYYPYMAEIPDNASGPVTATQLSSSTLAMPLSVAFLPPNTLRGTIDLEDFYGDKTTIPVSIQLRKQGETTVTTYTPTLSSTGTFEIDNLTSGTYDIRVKAWHWLAEVRTGIEISGMTTIPTAFSLVNGDADGDNEVLDGDVDLVSAYYGTQLGDPDFCASADFDGSLAVDDADIWILFATYGIEGQEFSN